MFVPRNPLTRQREYFKPREDVEKQANAQGEITLGIARYAHDLGGLQNTTDNT